MYFIRTGAMQLTGVAMVDPLLAPLQIKDGDILKPPATETKVRMQDIWIHYCNPSVKLNLRFKWQSYSW